MDYSALKSIQLSPEDVCVIPFSSGTTGLPKGVVLRHKQLVAGLQTMNVPNPYQSLTQPTTIDNQDVLECFLPFFHIYGLQFLLFSKLSLGCKLVATPRFDPKTYISAIAKHKVTLLPIVPSIVKLLANDDRCTAKHLSHVRTIACGAAPIGKESVERFVTNK